MKKTILTVLVLFGLTITGCNEPDTDTVTITEIGNGNCKAVYQGRETIASCEDIAQYANFIHELRGAGIENIIE
jgi:hypothetical protein